MIRKVLLHYGFLIPLILFGVHQLMQRVLEISVPFADAYLDPFCAGAMAPYLLMVERKYFFDDSRLSLLDLATLFAVLTAVSEVVFPLFSERFVTDWWDALAILLGILWYRFTRIAL